LGNEFIGKVWWVPRVEKEAVYTIKEKPWVFTVGIYRGGWVLRKGGTRSRKGIQGEGRGCRKKDQASMKKDRTDINEREKFEPIP